MQGWYASLKLAWKDLMAEGRRSLFFALLIAAGVASLVGVQGVAGALERGTRDGARAFIQADLRIGAARDLTAGQREALEALKRDGAAISEYWNTAGIARAEGGTARAMVDIKGVDPQSWPYYGKFAVSSGKPLQEGITGPAEAVVAPELLDRLQVNVGESITLGKSRVKVTGVIAEEPRGINLTQIPVGPAVIMSVDGVKQAFGDAQVRSVLIRLPDTITVEAARERLKAAFPGKGDVESYEESWQEFATIMGYFFTFLSLVAFISLLVGGLGVAMAMRTFIGQKLEQIAVLKALGSTSGRIMAVFLFEAAILGAAGSLLGVALGLGVQQLLPLVLGGLFPDVDPGLNLAPAAGGFAAGLATAVICALLPVRAVRSVKPDALFRSDSVPVRAGWRTWVEAVLVAAAVAAGLGWLASAYAGSAAVGFGFLGSLVAAGLQLFLVCWVLLRLVRLLPQSGRPAWRHAVRSLYAPGSQAAAVVVSMGLGITLMVMVYLLQDGLIRQVQKAGTGPDTPNVFLMNVSPEQRTEIRNFLRGHSGVAATQTPAVVANMTILAVDGRSAADLKMPSMLQKPFPVLDGGAELPKGLAVKAGEWFSPADAGKPVMAIDETFAKQMGNPAPGSTLRVRVKNQELEFTVKALVGRSGKGVQVGVNSPLMVAPGAIDAYAEMYLLTAVTRAKQEQQVISDLMGRFPGVTAFGLSSLMDVVNEYLGKLANILRFMTAFALVASGVILSGSISATRFRRRKEAALLKTLGASRFTVAWSAALENALLGAVAGLAGGGLGYLVVQGAAAGLELTLAPALWPLGAAALGGALLTVLVGGAAMVDVLRTRPLAVLRGE